MALGRKRYRATSGSDQGMVVTPLEQVKCVPIDPIKPNGNQIAVAEGDPASGLSSMYLEFKKGVNPHVGD